MKIRVIISVMFFSLIASNYIQASDRSYKSNKSGHIQISDQSENDNRNDDQAGRVTTKNQPKQAAEQENLHRESIEAGLEIVKQWFKDQEDYEKKMKKKGKLR